MTNNKAISSIALKLEWAKKNAQELRILARTFLDSNPYQVECRRDPKTNRPSYVVSSVREPPAQISIIIGSILHDLRSSLDYMAYHLVSLGTKSVGPFSHVYFPIYESASKYNAKSAERNKGMKSSAIKAIDAIKPYQGGNDWLWHIHELNIIDKHRLVITIGSAYQNFDIGSIARRALRKTWVDSGSTPPEDPDLANLSIRIRPADKKFPLKKGDVLLIDAVDAEPDYEILFNFDIALGEPTTLVGKPVIESVQKMIDSVDDVYTHLFPFLA